MKMPNTPSVELGKDGKVITGMVTAYHAAQIIISGLDDTKKTAILGELITSDEQDGYTPENIFDGDEDTPRKILNSYLVHIIGEKMFKVIGVQAKSDQNMEVYDEFVEQLESDTILRRLK